MTSAAQPFLSFGDILLRVGDVDLLTGRQWLNDQLIAFWFAYLESSTCSSSLWSPAAAGPAVNNSSTTACITGIPVSCGPEGSGAGPTRVCQHATASSSPVSAIVHTPQRNFALLDGSMCFLLSQAGAHAAQTILAPLQLHTKALVLMAVNDETDVQRAGGGLHWSLLAYHRRSNTFRHYDSASGHGNAMSARCLATSVCDTLIMPPSSSSGSAVPSQDSVTPPTFVEVHMPSQVNGYDCGVYVLAVTLAACNWAEQEERNPETGSYSLQEDSLTSWLTPEYVTRMRDQVLQVIQHLANVGSNTAQ